VLLHELAHALAGARFGLIANSLEFALYFGFIPIVYLRIPGLYTLSPRRRVIVWSAGIFLNLILAAIGMAYLIWQGTAGAALNIWYVVILVNYSLVVTNLVPFLPTDAYFILSTVFHVHNIRRNAMHQLALSVQARRLRVSPIGSVYLVFTILLLILTLWRDVILLARLPVGRVFSADVGSVFLILPWALLAVQIFRHRSKLLSKGGPRGVGTK
jgi:putative peptide zinc metalloprotease protein